MKSNQRIRQLIGVMFMNPDIAVACANLGKTPDKHMTLADWPKVAMSLPRLYAVVEAAELAISMDLAPNLNSALVQISDSTNAQTSHIANVAARLAWQAQQPLIGQDRLSRSIMGCTSASLPPGELEKDIDRVKMTAAFVLDFLATHADEE